MKLKLKKQIFGWIKVLIVGLIKKSRDFHAKKFNIWIIHILKKEQKYNKNQIWLRFFLLIY